MAVCSGEGCTRLAKWKDLCSMHYKRAWRHGDPNKVHVITKYDPCSVQGCTGTARQNGMCKAHDARMRRHGTTDLVRRANGTGAVTNAGYILITVDGVRKYEHIHVAEEALGRPLPDKAVVHHMNEKPMDNHTFMNLIICPNQAYHMLLHKRMRDLGYPS